MRSDKTDAMPRKLSGFIAKMGRGHQAFLVLLSVFLFAVGILPLEVQRRIVNGATQGAGLDTILVLVLAYLALALTEGGIKLVLNVYRGWIGEVAIRWLPMVVIEARENHPTDPATLAEGVEMSIVLAEAEPVGGFVGTSISEPILQAGILLAVGGYMIYLQPFLALAVIAVFVPQAVLVPILQRIHQPTRQDENHRHSTSQRRNGRSRLTEVAKASGCPCAATVFDKYEHLPAEIRAELLDEPDVPTRLRRNFCPRGYYVITGRIEIGTVVAFIAGLNKVSDPWGALVDWYRDLQVTQVKYGLIRDASALGPSQPSAA